MTNTDYVVARLVNALSTAEGSQLPLRLKAGIRVPTVTNLKVAKKERIDNVTEFTLTWTEPEPLTQVSNHLIYVSEFSAIDPGTVASFSSKRSPAKIRIVGDEDLPVTFTVTTVLNNGQASLVTDSPSISSRTIVAPEDSGNIMQAYLPYPPAITSVTYVTTAVPPAFTAVTCLSDTGAGRIIGIGFRVVAPTAASTENLQLGIAIDGNPPSTTPIVTATVWEHSILSLPGSGNMGTAADWRYYHLSTPYNTSAVVTAYKNAAVTPSTFSVEVTVFYEKAV